MRFWCPRRSWRWIQRTRPRPSWTRLGGQVWKDMKDLTSKNRESYSDDPTGTYCETNPGLKHHKWQEQIIKDSQHHVEDPASREHSRGEDAQNPQEDDARKESWSRRRSIGKDQSDPRKNVSRCAPCSTVVSHCTFHPMHLHWLKAWWIKSACVSCAENSALAPQSFLHIMSCRNLLGVPERRSTFPDGLEKESGIPCIDPGGGGWFDRLVDQSPLTGYEPKNLIEISSQHTPINFPSRRNSFNTDFNDAPTVAASDDTDTLDAGMTSPLLTQERETNPISDSVHRQAVASDSSNPQQPASPYVMHEGVAGNCNIVFVIMMKGVAGNCNGAIAQKLKNPCWMETEIVNLAVYRPKNHKDSCLRDKISMITLEEKPRELFKLKAQLTENYLIMERDRMIREKRNSDWTAMNIINSQLDSQQWELHHATSGFVKLKWKAAESSKNYGEFVMKRRKELDTWEQMNFMFKRKKNLLRWISSCLRSTLCKTRWMPWIASYWRNLFSKLCGGNSEVCFFEIAFRKIPRPRWHSVLESQLQDRSVRKHIYPWTHHVVDQWSADGWMDRRS